MNQDNGAQFIFFLVLDENLPKHYYVFDKFFKDQGYILVPVKIDQLQLLAASTSQNHLIVISSVTDAKECKLYNDKVRGLLKYVLKSKRITFMLMGSFSKLNDVKNHTLTKNYFFLKYPLDARLIVAQIARYHDLKTEEKSRWPGGRRAGVGAMTA